MILVAHLIFVHLAMVARFQWIRGISIDQTIRLIYKPLNDFKGRLVLDLCIFQAIDYCYNAARELTPEARCVTTICASTVAPSRSGIHTRSMCLPAANKKPSCIF